MNNNRTDSWLDRPIVEGVGLKWEHGLYVLIILVCLVSRLAMLGYRVQSHDESLHTQHSWYLYAGQGYQHNPMMHGPFLYHVTAFSYFLFGDNDFTARLPVALMGTALVAFPYLLRRYMGRTGALMTSLLLLISPSITYYSRYIRMDVPSMLWALVVIWAVFRYLDEGQDRHLYILAGGLSLMYATKEVAPIYTMIIALFLACLFVVRALKQAWHRPRAEMAFLGALMAAALGLVVLALAWLAGGPAEEMALPWWGLAGGILAVVAVIAAGVALFYGLWGRLRGFRSLDLIVLIGTLSLPFASPLPMHLASRLGSLVAARGAAPEAVPAFLSNLANLEILNYHAPHIYYSGAILGLVLLAAIGIGLAWDRRRWLVAAAIHTAIFLVLFTAVFTNGAGVASGWVGSVGYWLEQQEVERGSQPWFYYLVVLPMYDFLPLLGALVAPVFLAVRGLIDRLRGDRRALPGMRPPFILFVLAWALLAWVGYSYAGERMAWLTVHITLPMILLTGWLLSLLIDAVDWRKVWQSHGWLLVGLLPALVVALVATGQAAAQGPLQGVELDQLLVTGTFLGGLLSLAFLGLLVGLLLGRAGTRNGLLLAALTVFLALGLLTVRVAYRFSFINFDRPAEFLVYAHEGPDVRTTMEQLEQLSLRVGGGERLIDVSYGPDGSWPFTWYLRNYPNARFYPEQPGQEQVLATAVIAGQQQWSVVEPYLGDDYHTFDYFYLWWPVEDYRQLTLQKLWDWLTDSQKRAALWQIFYNMNYGPYDEITGKRHSADDWPLHSSFRFYVRKDVANRLWGFGVGPVQETETSEADLYGDLWQPLESYLVWGTEGSGLGQFTSPRGIAVSSDGFVYVADSQNHRVQKFTAEGLFVNAWGTYGNCGQPGSAPAPGTFCEPWDVAVGPDGSVYVADTWAHRIQKFTADGAFLTEWGTFGQYSVGAAGYFYGPRAVAVGPDGEVYVADTGNKRVQVFSPEGRFLRMWGEPGAGPGQLEEPVGIAVGPDGRVIVADSWNFRVQVLEPDGEPVLRWPITGWDNPSVDEKPYVAVDREGRVYVTDPGHYRLLVFDSEGTYLYSFGEFGFDPSSFSLPMGVAVGPDGSLYVTDAASHRVLVFQLPQ